MCLNAIREFSVIGEDPVFDVERSQFVFVFAHDVDLFDIGLSMPPPKNLALKLRYVCIIARGCFPSPNNLKERRNRTFRSI